MMNYKDHELLAKILRRNGYVVFKTSDNTESLLGILKNANLSAPTYNILVINYAKKGKNIFDVINDVENGRIRRFRNIGAVRFKEIEEWIEEMKSKLITNNN